MERKLVLEKGYGGWLRVSIQEERRVNKDKLVTNQDLVPKFLGASLICVEREAGRSTGVKKEHDT